MLIQITVRVRCPKGKEAAYSIAVEMPWVGETADTASKFILAKISEQFPQHHTPDSED